MVLEATMICVDNSEWMRNGDYSPNRLESQLDAVNFICGTKTQMNPENTVGVLATAGKNVRVLLTPTTDLAKILTCTHGLELEGESKLTEALKIAHLALKHRQNKNLRQRIILFAGSPLTAERTVLEKIGQGLKKNNVALDIVNFGEMDEEKTEKLEALLEKVINNNNSRILHVEPGSGALCEMIAPILGGADGQGSEPVNVFPGDSPARGFEFGVDPNVDPELALALRVSMEEERARQEAAGRNAVGVNESSGAVPDVTMIDIPMADPVQAPDVGMDEEALLAQALALSMADDGASDIQMEEADEALVQALQMSMSSDGNANPDMGQVFGDTTFVNQIISSLPGVDPNDPAVRDVIATLSEQGKKDKNNDNSKK